MSGLFDFLAPHGNRPINAYDVDRGMVNLNRLTVHTVQTAAVVSHVAGIYRGDSADIDTSVYRSETHRNYAETAYENSRGQALQGGNQYYGQQGSYGQQYGNARVGDNPHQDHIDKALYDLVRAAPDSSQYAQAMAEYRDVIARDGGPVTVRPTEQGPNGPLYKNVVQLPNGNVTVYLQPGTMPIDSYADKWLESAAQGGLDTRRIEYDLHQQRQVAGGAQYSQQPQYGPTQTGDARDSRPARTNSQEQDIDPRELKPAPRGASVKDSAPVPPPAEHPQSPNAVPTTATATQGGPCPNTRSVARRTCNSGSS